MKKTLKAVTLVAGLTLLSSPVSSFAATYGTTAVQYHNQWVKKGSFWTYYNANGALQKGWLSLNNKWYFFDANGYMKTGWVSVSGKWYYFDANGVMKTGWVKVSTQWYFFDASGVMKTGWVKSGSDWYYMNANGTMKTGWLQTGGKWYYLNPTSGKMALGWNNINGKTYYFYNTGIMAVNTTIEGKQIGADGAAVDPTLNKIKEVAAGYGVTVEYDAENDVYDLFQGDEYIASVVADGIVFADAAHEELFKKLALALGAPVTETELNDLIAQAQASETLDVDTGSVYVAADETGFEIVWGTAYSGE
ncbi:hypothetical protein PH210_25615 [Paenibacillus sp. BSR1-1]|uniref:hypothetical protein n=1 Tax=Paenibacillus sp. BSR1-1 TaxID=3020845 RepID=UPI0025B0693B|nr:hypothetical protein [Paenibacillus sp. BSR1-1]MDN3019546.1 hypothetical protein [Paenibacillus sp. BSR1-1]